MKCQKPNVLKILYHIYVEYAILYTELFRCAVMLAIFHGVGQHKGKWDNPKAFSVNLSQERQAAGVKWDKSKAFSANLSQKRQAAGEKWDKIKAFSATCPRKCRPRG